MPGTSGGRGYREFLDDESKASGMPGKKITDQQVHKYRQHRDTLAQVAAAAKAGLSERSARRMDGTDELPSQRDSRLRMAREPERSRQAFKTGHSAHEYR